MNYFKKIVGERVYLSPARIEDAEKYVEWLSDPNVTNYLGSPYNITLLREKKLLEDILSKDEQFYAIINKETDKIIGNTSFFNTNRISQKSEIGIFIGDKNFRDKGIGQEVMRLMIDYGFNILNFHSIFLHTYSFNKRAIAAYNKIGFKEVGRYRDGIKIGQKYFDVVAMDILHNEIKDSSIQKLLKEQGIL